MSYNIDSGQGLIFQSYILHTCETEVHMIVYVVTDFHGNVWGVFTKETKALAKQEELRREMGVGVKVSKMEVNRNGTQDKS